MKPAYSLMVALLVCVVAMIAGNATGYQFYASWIGGLVAGHFIARAVIA